MSFMNAIQSMLPRLENRSRDQIARDVEDELAFHLEMRTRAIESEEGVDRATAGELARTRFGNVDQIRNECQRIALKERNVLQRVNFVLMIVVMLVVVGVGAQVYITQRYNTLALQAITSDLAKMKFDAAAMERERSGASAAGNVGNDVGGEPARVLVEGDVAGIGWHAIDMDQGTRLADLLAELKVRDDQWITYRRNGASSPASPKLVKPYLIESGNMVLRPNDELTIRNEVPVETRRGYYMSQWRLGPDRVQHWSATQADGTKWHARVAADRNSTSSLLREGSPQEWSLAFDPDGFSLTATEGNRWYSKQGDWDVVNEQLVLDFSNLRQNPRRQPQPPSSPLPAMPEIKGKLAFDRSPDASAFVQAARAKAVGDFVVRLFALADPNDPNLDQTIREFLDAEEKAVDLRYADDPATAGMIRELIAARRKIFESDAAIQRAATAEAQAAAIADFLKDTLTAVDSNAPAMHASDVLESASRRVDEEFADNPQVAAQLRERIAEARKALDAPSTSQPASAPAGGMSDAELQKFIPRLMTASIPNSAASTLPTLEELNRAASSIDIAYANDPTLLAKLHGMVETVRKRLDSAPPQSPTTSPGG